MTKFALPALALIIFGLFYFSITSQPPDEPVDTAPQRTEVTPQPTVVAAPEKAAPDRVEQLAKSIDGIGAELKRLSNDTKANSDKIAQAAAQRPDQPDSQASSEKTAQSIDALRSDQAKLLQEAKDSNDKAAQALRQEFAAAQTKLVAQVGDTLKASTARSDALAQRVDAMKKDIDDVRKSIEEDRQNASNISPGLALVVALAALVLGPFVARQLTANQLAAAKRQAEAEAAAARQQAARTPPPEPPLASAAATDLPHHDSPQHDAPPPGDDTSPHDDVSAHQRATPDSEKV